MQLPNVTDTLTSGQIIYVPALQNRSFCAVPGGSTTDAIQTIDDPFNMVGQSFSSSDSTSGFSVVVDC